MEIDDGDSGETDDPSVHTPTMQDSAQSKWDDDLDDPSMRTPEKVLKVPLQTFPVSNCGSSPKKLLSRLNPWKKNGVREDDNQENADGVKFSRGAWIMEVLIITIVTLLSLLAVCIFTSSVVPILISVLLLACLIRSIRGVLKQVLYDPVRVRITDTILSTNVLLKSKFSRDLISPESRNELVSRASVNDAMFDARLREERQRHIDALKTEREMRLKDKATAERASIELKKIDELQERIDELEAYKEEYLTIDCHAIMQFPEPPITHYCRAIVAAVPFLREGAWKAFKAPVPANDITYVELHKRRRWNAEINCIIDVAIGLTSQLLKTPYNVLDRCLSKYMMIRYERAPKAHKGSVWRMCWDDKGMPQQPWCYSHAFAALPPCHDHEIKKLGDPSELDYYDKLREEFESCDQMFASMRGEVLAMMGIVQRVWAGTCNEFTATGSQVRDLMQDEVFKALNTLGRPEPWSLVMDKVENGESGKENVQQETYSGNRSATTASGNRSVTSRGHGSYGARGNRW